MKLGDVINFSNAIFIPHHRFNNRSLFWFRILYPYLKGETMHQFAFISCTVFHLFYQYLCYCISERKLRTSLLCALPTLLSRNSCFINGCDAGFFYNKTSQLCEPSQSFIRLTGGATNYEGRIELLVGN